jgi:3'-phosphoadenosine 5'-phosphosulfate sulfotransferase (PAPS reductase)/FAD synthetase
MNPYKIKTETNISFSGGRTSAFMLWKVLEAHDGKLPDMAKVLFANTGKEDEATLRFVKNVQDKWGVDIVWLEYTSEKPNFKIVNFETASRNGEPFEEVIRHYKKVPNPAQRWCTGILKIRTMHKYLRSIGWDNHHETDNDDFVGIRADEHRRAIKMARHKVPLYVDGITKADVLNFWKNNEFDLDLPTIEGETVGGNCDLCFLKSLPKILTLINQNPKRALWWAKMESINADILGDGTGCRFRKDRPSYADLATFQKSQGQLFDEQDIPCFCGD